MSRTGLVFLLLLGVVTALACSDSSGDGDADGDGDLDGDADGDADGDGDGDGDVDADGDADGDADADDPPNTDWIPTCAPPADEVCGNCCDEDGDGEDEVCPLDEVFLTPRVIDPGGTVDARICTRNPDSYACVDLRCVQDGRVADARLVDAEARMGLFCWELEVTLPTSGEWSCFFLRLRHDGEVCSDAAGVDIRGCQSVEVR